MSLYVFNKAVTRSTSNLVRYKCIRVMKWLGK